MAAVYHNCLVGSPAHDELLRRYENTAEDIQLELFLSKLHPKQVAKRWNDSL